MNLPLTVSINQVSSEISREPILMEIEMSQSHVEEIEGELGRTDRR